MVVECAVRRLLITFLGFVLSFTVLLSFRCAAVQAWKTELKEVVALQGYLREQVKQKPNDYLAHLQKADGFRVLVLGERGTGASVNEMPEYWEALDSYQKVLELNPGEADLHIVYLSMATLFHRNLQTTEAIHYHHKALEIEPKNDNTHMLLGYLYETSGMYAEAAEAYQTAIELNTFNLDAHSRIATMTKYRNLDDALFVKLRAAYANALESEDEDSGEEIYDFTLAKAYRDIGDTKKSFYHLVRANQLTRQKFGYSFESHYNIASQMVQLFSPEVWGETWDLDTSGNGSHAPIFVVGMPRSGSTLVEQIISSHSTVFAGGEDTPMAPLMSRMIPEIYARAGQSASPLFHRYGNEYIERMLERANLADGSNFTRFTDKHLMNFWLIGIIHMLLPNAKIVHTRRNPMDTLYSCYKHRFEKGSIDFSYTQEDLAQFYVLYRQVMEHWEEVIPSSKLLTIQYEDLVYNQEEVTRQILKHCNLEWEDGVLRFHESDRQVLTHSAGQVRKPLYNGSINGWKVYEEEFSPMAMMIGKYGPYSTLFTKEQASQLAMEVLFDHGKLQNCFAMFGYAMFCCLCVTYALRTWMSLSQDRQQR